jgi:hypothetical protein
MIKLTVIHTTILYSSHFAASMDHVNKLSA